ncbi:glycosyl transferase [Geobacter sp. SVR]|nr:glycosyl transferase [Geobacter sp. SVR]GCF84382.1 glycosyl transferase [Geobacter sp. SVR]
MTADAIGGIWTYALELARGLSEHGIEVVLATMGQPLTVNQRIDAQAIPALALHESTFRLEWMQDPWEDVERSGTWLLSLADRFGPDLVHLNGFTHAALPWSRPCLVAAHSCALSWWQAVRKEALPSSFKTYRERVSEGLTAAGLVTAPSTAMLRSIGALYRPPAMGRVIHNGRSRGFFEAGKKADFILTVGRLWDEAKNIGAVAKSAGSLPWPIYIAGEQQHPEGSPVRFNHVRHLGYLPPPRLASWFATASIYAHPARYEPFGLTVLEAAMSRCALVLGDIPSLRELWQDAAILVPPDDQEALAATLTALCRDRQLRERWAEKAFFRSRSFSVEKMAAGYLDAYASLTGSAAVPERPARKEA